MSSKVGRTQINDRDYSYFTTFMEMTQLVVLDDAFPRRYKLGKIVVR